MRQNILIADDHPLLLQGLQATLEKLPIINKIFVASDGKQALDTLLKNIPEIAILDINMPFYSGIEIAQKVSAQNLPTKIIFLTLHKEKSLFDLAEKYGVVGYVLKEFSLDEIEKCVNKVVEGGKFVSPAILKVLKMDEGMDLSHFTKAEINIIRLIGKQKTTPEIAELLFVSSKKIEDHQANIIKKLELKPTKDALLKWVLHHKDSLF